ncbi:hypothetical protein [Streptomyces flavofungini]|uniref:hypothetical protein n=1 Tax=Streptomyces flavofungini TaxID=68200 RepID=UPI0034DDFB2D
MKGVELLLRNLHDGETRMAGELTAVAGHHAGEPEVRHVAKDLATWSRAHVRRLADAAGERRLALEGPPDPSAAAFLRAPAATASRADRETGHPGLLLLGDLRALHLAASENSLHWVMLAQAAQATRDPRLLQLTTECHPQTLRQINWTDTMVKTLSPQILTGL